MIDTFYALPVDPDVPPAPAEVVNKLVVADLPVGITRVFVELVGDGLATGIRVPVLVARGEQPGPTFGITACIHGNELNGIRVIHELFQGLDAKHLRGSVVGVIALNIPGLHLYRREFSDGTDLNRIMPGDQGGNVAQVYAYRILDRIVWQLDYLLDLHTASFGRANSLYVRATMTDERTATMAYLQRPEIIVHKPASDSTLRGAAMQRGIPAITVEIGNPQTWQRRYTESALSGVRSVLSFAGVLDGSPDGLRATPEPAVCRSSSWMYTDRGGLLEVYPELTERVESGRRVATVRNAFGDTIREYRAPRAGIVIGKSVNPVGQTGSRILHLGIHSEPGDGLLTRTACGLATG